LVFTILHNFSASFSWSCSLLFSNLSPSFILIYLFLVGFLDLSFLLVFSLLFPL
jgi:hypothetical protein